MIVKNMSPRALERLAVIEAEAPVKEAAALMSRPHTDLFQSPTTAAGRLASSMRARLCRLLSEAENQDELLRDYISGVGYR